MWLLILGCFPGFAVQCSIDATGNNKPVIDIKYKTMLKSRYDRRRRIRAIAGRQLLAGFFSALSISAATQQSRNPSKSYRPAIARIRRQRSC